jgi:hypothetical protein
MNKKAMHWEMLLAIIMTGLVLVGIILWVFWPIIQAARIGTPVLNECTGAFEKMTAAEYKAQILRFSTTTREDGAPNELYEPGYAVRLFNTYAECRDLRHKFTAPELQAEDQAIISAAKAAYVSRAEQLCKDFCDAKKEDPEDTEGESKDILKSHSLLRKDYKRLFGGESLQGQACSESCQTA